MDFTIYSLEVQINFLRASVGPHGLASGCQASTGRQQFCGERRMVRSTPAVHQFPARWDTVLESDFMLEKRAMPGRNN